jgi:leucyl aminopeptidase (aminopeptidase T)
MKPETFENACVFSVHHLRLVQPHSDPDYSEPPKPKGPSAPPRLPPHLFAGGRTWLSPEELLGEGYGSCAGKAYPGVDVVEMDPMVERLADILVGYSVDVRSGDVVMISADPDGLALVQEVYRKVLQRGGFPRLRMSVPGAARIYYEEASDEQLGTLLPIDLAEYEASDCLISISAPANLSEMANVSPAKLSKRQRTMQPISDWVMKSNVRWCGCNFPCNALAQKAEMSLAEYEEFVFGATNIDWPTISRRQEEIVSLFSKGREVRRNGS